MLVDNYLVWNSFHIYIYLSFSKTSIVFFKISKYQHKKQYLCIYTNLCKNYFLSSRRLTQSINLYNYQLVQRIGDMEKEIVKTAVFLHGLSEFKKGNAVAAIDIFDPLLDIEIGPTPANEYEITLLRGLCYRDLGETKDAIDDFTSVIAAYDDLKEEEEIERLRLIRVAEESSEEEMSESSDAEESEDDDDDEDEDKEDEGKTDEEKTEGKNGETDEENSDEEEDDEELTAPAFVEVERIPVTEAQLEVALMNRSGSYSTMGSKKNSTLDYERIHKRKTNWKLIKKNQARLDRKEEKRLKKLEEKAEEETEAKRELEKLKHPKKHKQLESKENGQKEEKEVEGKTMREEEKK